MSPLNVAYALDAEDTEEVDFILDFQIIKMRY